MAEGHAVDLDYNVYTREQRNSRRLLSVSSYRLSRVNGGGEGSTLLPVRDISTRNASPSPALLAGSSSFASLFTHTQSVSRTFLGGESTDLFKRRESTRPASISLGKSRSILGFQFPLYLHLVC